MCELVSCYQLAVKPADHQLTLFGVGAPTTGEVLLFAFLAQELWTTSRRRFCSEAGGNLLVDLSNMTDTCMAICTEQQITACIVMTCELHLC